MVKSIFLIFILSTSIFSLDSYADNMYEKNCVACHKTLPISLQRMFMNYLLVYGGEENMKAGLKHYLTHPSKHISVMSELFITTYDIKNKTTLTSQELDESIDIYWDKYKVIEKLK